MTMDAESAGVEGPSEVRLSADRRRLTLVWPASASAALDARTIREACRCAWCTRDRALGCFPDGLEDIGIARLQLIGGHAVNIAFSDGHDRGVFPWAYLRGIAQGERAPIRRLG